MKAFARRTPKNRTATPEVDAGTQMLDLDDLDVAPLGVAPTAPPGAPSAGVQTPDVRPGGQPDEATREAEEFTERLGDLDRFIGGPSVPTNPSAPTGPSGPTGLTGPPSGSTPAVSWAPSVPARNLRAAPTGALAPISHPRPAAAPSATPDAAPVADADAGDDFVQRLGDLDRFIGGPATPAPAPVAPARAAAPAAPVADERPATDPEDEAQDFLDRLGDLDRFIGGDHS